MGDRLDKKEYSLKNLSWIIALIFQGFFLYFSLKEAIHDEITQRMASISILEEKIKSLENRLPDESKKTSEVIIFKPAILPEKLIVTKQKPFFKFI